MKRKCGTCKYFEDRGVANSGTCQHIQRRELRDVVLVRQSELACRNSWDQDLWEPGKEELHSDGESPAYIATGESSASDNGRGRWDNEEIFRGAEDVPMLSPFGEQVDRVTDIQVPVTPRSQSGTRISGGLFNQPAAEADDDGWMARPSVYDVRKRREEERRREIQTRQAAELRAIDQQMESPDAIGASVDPASVWSAGEAARVFGRATEPRHDFDREQSRSAPSPHSEREPQRRLEGSVNLTPPQAMAQPVSQGTEPLPTHEVNAALGQDQRARTSSEPFVHIDGGTFGAPVNARAQEHVTQLPDPDSSDPLDRDDRVHALKRCCATCRDFRQVGDGTRGQCVNPYAFSERRMVQSDQLACRSSLGMWWMPTDEIWLERADTSHHGRPTPLLDAAARGEKVGHGGRDSRRR